MHQFLLSNIKVLILTNLNAHSVTVQKDASPFQNCAARVSCDLQTQQNLHTVK